MAQQTEVVPAKKLLPASSSSSDPFRRVSRLKRGTAEKNKSFTMLRQAARKEEIRILHLEVGGWLAAVLSVDDHGLSVLGAEGVVTGKYLCALVRRVDPSSTLVWNERAKVGSFHARENIQAFVAAALEMGVPAIKQIEVEDVIQQKNARAVLYFVLEFAEQAFIKFGTPLPAIVKAKMDIERMMKEGGDSSHGSITAVADFPRVTPSLEHREYVPLKDNALDEWVAEYCNSNAVPVTATPTPLPLGSGQYIFAAEEPPFHIHYVAMIRDVPLVRVGDGWEPFAQLIHKKMQAAFASGAAYIATVPVPAAASITEEKAGDDEDDDDDGVDVFDFDYKYEQRIAHIMALDGLHLRVELNESLRRVFTAFTWNVNQWWSAHTEFMGTPDTFKSGLKVVFGDDDYNTVDILHTHCDKREAFAAWRISESTFDMRPTSWSGTNVFWHFCATGDQRTELHLLHYPITSGGDGDAYDATMRAWVTYVTHSLKPLVESGAGRPYPNPWSEGPAEWQSNDTSDACMCCDKKFTVLVRRHHCRQCGLLVCKQCSRSRKVVPRVDQAKKVRVCDTCR